MRNSPAGMLVVLALAHTVSLIGCDRTPREHSWPELNTALELEIRLGEVNFSLQESDADIVDRSWEILDEGDALPELWEVDFAGTETSLPTFDAGDAVGIRHPNGRFTAVYPMPGVALPVYGEIEPVAVAHYFIPQPRLDILLLLVCFQADPDGAQAGIGIRSVNTDGVELSAPFAIVLNPVELSGLFFYDDFISGGEDQRVAAREDWDRGFLLLTRLGEEAVLSTYLPWY